MNHHKLFNLRGRRACARGFSLVEMMVAMAIGLFLVVALVVVYVNVQRSYANEDQLVQLQDGQRLALSMLNATVSVAGYFVNPASDTRVGVFGATNFTKYDGTVVTYASTQFITGSGNGTGSGATSDTLTVRYQTANADGLLNCNGATNNTGANTVFINSFTIGSANELLCSVNAAAPVALSSNVGKMTVVYGVDTGGNGAVDTYLTAPVITAASLWPNVYSVVVSLWFLDTTRSTPGNPVLLPNPIVQTIGLQNMQ